MSGKALRFSQLAVREAEFLVGVSHPNIIRFEGFVEDVSKNIIWLVFPWADNGNLKDFVSSQEWEIPERISLVRSIWFSLTLSPETECFRLTMWRWDWGTSIANNHQYVTATLNR